MKTAFGSVRKMKREEKRAKERIGKRGVFRCRKTVVFAALVLLCACAFASPVWAAEAAHMHTDECYVGTKHTHDTGCSEKEYCDGWMNRYVETRKETVYCGTYRQHSGTYDRNLEPSGRGWCSNCKEYYDTAGVSTWIHTYCSDCGEEVGKYHYAYCPLCGKLNESRFNSNGSCTRVTCSGCDVSGTAGEYHFKEEDVDYYTCSSCWCGLTSWYGSSCSNYWNNNICGKTEGTYYKSDGSEDVPICNRVVTALDPVEPVQTISAGQTPNVQAVATFRDGTTKTVTCSYTGFSATTYNTEQTITLSYGTYHDSAKTPGAKKCTIKVMVQGYFTLTVSCAQQGRGSVTGGGTKLAGSAVTVNATPSGSNRFAGWYEGSTLVSAQASYRFTMPARNVVLVAHFIRIPVSLTVVPDKNMVYNGSEPSYAVKVEYSDGSSVALSPLQYTKSGFTKGTGVKTVRFSYTESGVTVTTAISVTVIRNTRTCKHGHIYELSDKDTDEGCSKCATTLDSISAYPSEQAVSLGETPNFLVTGTYLDGHSVALYGWTTNFNSTGLGVQYVTIAYGERTCQAVVKVVKTFTCGVCSAVYEANEDLSNPGCPECRRSCVSIAVSPATQMVEQGSPISIAVTARFRDGHTEEVTDWSSNYRPYTIGKQQVAVMYGGRTASVEVEVVAKKAVCINCGTAYDPMQGWCPNCGHILSAIRASTLDGSNLVIRGIRPEFKVYGIYLDGHEERIEGGYTYSGLDIYTTGVQNVTVMYGGFSCSVTVTVLDSAGYNMCEKGHVYRLNSDGSDPGCPYCSIDEDDKTEKFYTTIYTDEIIGQLYRDGVYYLKDGDAVTITVKRQEKSGIVKLFDWIFNRFGDALNIKAGGMVGE